MLAKGINVFCVVGAGVMGQQIALQAARSGYTTYCTDINSIALTKAQDFSHNWLFDQVNKGRITEQQADVIRERLIFTQDLNEAAGQADIVIEAIAEILEIKRQLFSQLDKVCPLHTILATNSSYLVSSKIADATNRPDKVLNMHFFNPALVMKLVEVVKGSHVSEETIEIAVEICQTLNKTPARVNKEIYGFIANRIFSAITQEACYLLDQEVASIEDIDRAVRNGLGHPMGPFELLDMTGIDLEYDVLMGKYRSCGDIKDKPSPAIVERYAQGQYGRKTNKGFYDYSK